MRNFILKIIGDVVTLHTERGTTQIKGSDRTAQLRDAFATMGTEDLWKCPVCENNLVQRGYVCETCSNDVRR